MKINQLKYKMEEVYKWKLYIDKGHSITEASKFFNIPYKSILNLLNRHKLRIPTRHTPSHRINPLNITYFDNIDSEDKAYFLGFLFADGYICKGNYESGKLTGIALQLLDKYILEYLHKELNLKTKLNIYKNSVKLVITDVHLYNSLNNLGIKENKSNCDYNIPNIPHLFLNSFILGYFDGDGCIGIRKTRYHRVSICCNSKIFLLDIQTILLNNNIHSTIYELKKPNNILYDLCFNKIEELKKFAKFIYKNSSIYLTRKHNKFVLLGFV